MLRRLLVVVGLLCACGSTGGPLGSPDEGVGTILFDGGGRDGGGGRAFDGGSADAGGASLPVDGGGAAILDGGGTTEDGGSSERDAGTGTGQGDGGTTGSGCVGADLSGPWSGSFAGNVWWTSDPTSREPVSGTMDFTLVCQGDKYRVQGTMTGSESHAVRFSAQLSGEVTQSSQPQLNANMMGQVTFVTLGGVQVPFAGTMTGRVSGTQIPNGTWEGHSTAFVSAQGEGTWEAARR